MNMDTALKTLTINENMRVSLYQDETCYTPNELIGDLDGCGGYFLLPRKRYELEHYAKLSDGELTAELETLYRYAYDYALDSDTLNDALEKHVSRAGKCFQTLTLRGYSQGEWLDAIVYANELDAVKNIKNGLATWMRGDVYTMALESREVYTATDGDGLENWEVADSVGCMMFREWPYPDDGELLAAARSHFILEGVNA